MSDKYKKKEDGEVSGDDDDYKSSNHKKSDYSSKNDRKKSKRSSRSSSSRRKSDKTSESKKQLKNEKDHKESSHRRSKSRNKDRKDELKRKHSRSRSRSYQNDRNSTKQRHLDNHYQRSNIIYGNNNQINHSKKCNTTFSHDKFSDLNHNNLHQVKILFDITNNSQKVNLKDKEKESRRRSKSPNDKKTTKDKERKKDDRKRSKSPKSSNNGKKKSSRSRSNRRDETRKDNRDKDQKSSFKESEKKVYQTNRSEEKENRQLTLEEQEERNERYKYEYDDSDSGYYQRVDDRKQKTSKRSRSKSKKRDRKRSTSKKRDDKKSKTTNGNSSKTQKEDQTSSNKKQETKVKPSQIEEEYEDNAFDIELEDNSEDEREKKKQDFLNMIKGIQNPTDNQTLIKNDVIQNDEIQSSKEEKLKFDENSQNIDEESHKSHIDNFQNENSEEQIYDNNLFNPDDAIDDDDQNTGTQIDDDYKGEINESHLTHRPSFDKSQLEHLKDLEEMRNKETKGGLLDEPEPEQIPIQKRRSTKEQKKEEQHKKNDFFFDDIDIEQNNLHKLDDEQQSDEEADMFGDDIDKIIGKGADGNIQVVKGANAECDDEQNYYKILIGEILGGKYRVVQKCGKGVYANVCKAEQLDNGKLVAIKMLRSNEIMHESGEREKEIVQKLNQTDKNDKKHIVRLKNVFDHQKHLCLVFECFAMNLRDALKEYGKGKGFNLDVVRSYAFQIFVALTHLKKNRFIHADLKPDNLLISEDTKTLKMCDFGNVMQYEEVGIIKYIQSRYYRAPEVLIGCPPFTAIDVWSIGVTLYEIYTQKILFDGTTNNEMLKLIMDARGKFNKKMLQSGQYVNEYFDQNFIFKYIQVDPNTKQKYITPITYGDIPKNDINKLLQANKENLQFENQKKLSQFKDFLDKCLQLDPKNRITPEDALKHPFLDTTVKQK